MRRLSKLGAAAMLLAAAGLGLPATGGAADRLQRRQKAIAEGERLLAEERWDDALAAMAPWGQGVAEALRRRITEAKRGDPGKLLALYEAYFHYYPFGELYWHSDARRWGELACEYAQLLKASPKAKADEAAAQTVAAEPTYRKLMAAHQEYQEAQVLPLVQGIVGKYPKGIFAPAAVLTLANVKAQGDGARASPVCEEYLPLLRKGGAGERAQVLVLLTLGEACTDYGGDPERLRKGVAAYLEVAALTSVAYEKRFALLHAAQAALKIGKGDALIQCRKLFGEFIAKYPAVFEADTARRGLVQADLAERKPEVALDTLRALEKQAPEDSDLSEPLFDISRAHFGQQDYNKSLSILQEIVRRFPDSAPSSMAWLGMGEVYGKLGQEERMVEAYRTAAGKPTVETQTNIMDASDTSNRAHEWLGRYCEKKRNWEEALTWWKAWRPRSWCGTCAWGMEARKTRGITLCLLKLGRTDEALRSVEPVVFQREEVSSPELAILLVDIYRGKGALPSLEAKLQATLRKNERNSAASAARDYIAMIRMAEQGDAEGLWRRLEGDPFQDDGLRWPAAQAAALLASIPEKTKPVALRKLGGEGNASPWAAVLLARIRAPETLPLVRAKIGAQETCWAGHLYALALLGTDEAYAQLKAYAATGDTTRGIMARKMLERFPAPGDAATDLAP